MPYDPPQIPSEVTPPRLALTLDMEKYLGQLEDWDISEEQKEQFIAALWSLLVSIAEIGFEIHPVQQAQKPCGKLKNNLPNAALTAPDGLYLNDHFGRNFKAPVDVSKGHNDKSKGAS